MWPSPSKPELPLPFRGLLYCPLTNVGDVRRPRLGRDGRKGLSLFSITFTGAGAAEHLPNRLEERKKSSRAFAQGSDQMTLLLAINF